MRTVQVNVRLERDLAERARAAASQRSISVATLISAALGRELSDETDAAEHVRAVLAATRADVGTLAAAADRLADAVIAQSPPVLPAPGIVSPRTTEAVAPAGEAWPVPGPTAPASKATAPVVVVEPGPPVSPAPPANEPEAGAVPAAPPPRPWWSRLLRER